MTKSEQREFDRAASIASTMPELAARMVCTIHRAGSARTQAQIATFIAEHPAIKSHVRGTMVTGYFVA